MRARDVIRATVEDSGMSMRRVSTLLDRSTYFIASTAGQGKVPSIELMAEIGDVTGHDLVIRNRKTGKEIVVDPPAKDGE